AAEIRKGLAPVKHEAEVIIAQAEDSATRIQEDAEAKLAEAEVKLKTISKREAMLANADRNAKQMLDDARSEAAAMTAEAEKLLNNARAASKDAQEAVDRFRSKARFEKAEKPRRRRR
ncbi:MAG: hypothetical protein HKO63_10675, partial [Acidimicrobiia bacterium]|nr:hypothetical protein [Acidimicrobiia bacterium]